MNTVNTEEAAERNQADSTEPTGQDLMELIEHNPQLVLLNEDKRDALITHIEEQIAARVEDMTTQAGRDDCRKFAASITTTKTTADKARLQMTEDARQRIKMLNEAGKAVTEKLAELAAKARAPLTEWEEAEKKREAECAAALERLRTAAVVPLGISSDSLKARIAEVEAEPMDEGKWRKMLELATTTRNTALAALRAALVLIEQKEAEAAELTRLREEAAARAESDRLAAEEAERARIEAERLDREEKEARERERNEAELATMRQQEQAQAAERAEQERAEAAERQEAEAKERANAAAEAARAAAQREAEEKAAAERAEQQRLHNEALAAERARAEQAERAAEEAKQAEAARRADEERAAAERRAKEADENRRTQAKRDAKESIMTTGVTEEQARNIVLLIIAGEVPRVFLDFAAEARTKAPVKEGQLV